MSASERLEIDRLLSQARELAQARRWVDAAELTELAVAKIGSEETGLKGQIAQLLADIRFRQAFRATDRNSFKVAVTSAESLYEQASTEFLNASDILLSKRAKARSIFAKFWLSDEVSERRRAIEESLQLAREVWRSSRGHPNALLLAEVCNDLLSYEVEAMLLSRDSAAGNSHFHEALKAGRDAIQSSNVADSRDAVFNALVGTTRLIALYARVFLDGDASETAMTEAKKFGEELLQVAQKLSLPHAVSLAKEQSGNIAFNLEGDLPKAFNLFEEILHQPTETLDSFEKGTVLQELASVLAWMGADEDNSARRKELFEMGIRNAEDAIRSLSISYHTPLLCASHAHCAQCLIDLADTVEHEREKKREHLLRAVKVATTGANYEDGTLGWHLVAHSLSKAMHKLATTTHDKTERTKLLRETLSLREKILAVTDNLLPRFLWSRGVMRNYLALIKSELADSEDTAQARIELLRDAASLMEECSKLCTPSSNYPDSVRLLANYAESQGDILQKLHLLEPQGQAGVRAVQAYSRAIDYETQSGRVGPTGAIRWKIAKTLDASGDFSGASRAFDEADEDYRAAARRGGPPSSTFEELANYMQAWAHIENARVNHAEEEHDKAHRNYATAAALLKQTKSWSPLSLLLDARSLLEKGEALSQDEKSSAATESLKTALDRFRFAKEELQKTLTSTSDATDRKEIQDWLSIAQHRESYTLGRIALEEARALDKKGEKASSSRKYSTASSVFRTLASQMPVDRDRAEMETLAQFCESWALMKDAESRTSSELFAKASESFTEATKKATTSNLRLLAVGNAAICRALEFGTEYRQSRNVELYSRIKQQLEIASDHYAQAGFKRTGAWTRATQRIFDALLLLADAEGERDMRKKAELYHSAEKHLELAAKLYGEAGFHTKKQETLEQLDRTREEKDVLMASLKVLAEIPTASGSHLPAATLRGAQISGLEKFEEANVVGEVATGHREVVLGQSTVLSINMANVGKTAAILLSVDNAIPEGFEPESTQALSALQESAVDLKGKRLEYLKTHELKIPVRAVKRGVCEAAPRVTFVDEKGNYRSAQFQPVIITIRDAKLSEGTAAPLQILLPPDMRFENQRCAQVFQHLVEEFAKDHMTRRVVQEKAGWRSLMDMVKELNIPRSAFYGPGGRSGPVLTELEKRGFVETRIFPKERGRGGDIKKVRVAFENSLVRRIVERAVMEG